MVRSWDALPYYNKQVSLTALTPNEPESLGSGEAKLSSGIARSACAIEGSVIVKTGFFRRDSSRASLSQNDSCAKGIPSGKLVASSRTPKAVSFIP
jgi:hypothetical protein